jgi:hypothetical protein
LAIASPLCVTRRNHANMVYEKGFANLLLGMKAEVASPEATVTLPMRAAAA